MVHLGSNRKRRWGRTSRNLEAPEFVPSFVQPPIIKHKYFLSPPFRPSQVENEILNLS